MARPFELGRPASHSFLCRALCCASSAAHPVPPIPGITPPGCVAWYHNQYAQCFMCNGVDRHGHKRPAVP